MNINYETLIVDHIVDNFCGLKHLVAQVLLIEVMNWPVDGGHSLSFVHFEHVWPVYTTVLKVPFGLNIENTRDSSLM